MAKRNGFCIMATLAVVFAWIVAAPPEISAQTSKGIELFNAWQFKDAEAALREAAKADPGDIAAGYYLGLAVLLQDKHDEALKILLKAKETFDKSGQQARSGAPDEFQILIALARAHLELKQFPDAWKRLEAAEKIHKDAADVHVYKGFYYLQQENPKQALKELDKAMNLDARNAYAYYYAGHANLRQGQPAKAVELFKEFLQLAPLAPEAVKAKALIDALC